MREQTHKLDLNQLRQFLTIADLGSLSAAARKLGISQPSLSEMVGRLESQIGVGLLLRSARGAELTPAGQKLVEHARELLRLSDIALHEVRRIGQTSSGVVTIGLPPSPALIFSVPLAETIRNDFPDIQLRIIEAGSSHLREWLLDGRLDLACIYENQSLADLSTLTLFREELFLVASGDNWPPERKVRLAPNGAIEFSSVADLPLVMPTRGNGLRESFEHFCKSANVSIGEMEESESLYHIISMVSRGSVYSILPKSPITGRLAEGEMVAIPIIRPHTLRSIYIAHRKSVTLNPAMATIVNVLQTIATEAGLSQ